MSGWMERVLEPEVMDHPDDASDYDAMDFDEPDARLVVDAIALMSGARAPRIVDLGTGTASIPLRCSSSAQTPRCSASISPPACSRSPSARRSRAGCPAGSGCCAPT